MVIAPPPRHRVLRTLGKALKLNALSANTTSISDQDEAEKELEPGMMKLYSFYKPGLQARTYTVTVDQKTNIAQPTGDELRPLVLDRRGTGSEKTVVKQRFEVVYPQFEIPREDFHSVYPEQGLADQPKIAPHIVFTNPNLPWTRPIGDLGGEADADGNAMTWLALFPFDTNQKEDPENTTGPPISELRLSENESAALGARLGRAVNPTSVFSFPMTLGEYAKLDRKATVPAGIGGGGLFRVPKIPALQKLGQEGSTVREDAPVEVVFIRAPLFRKLFSSRSEPSKLDLVQFSHCAHLRKINTVDMTEAGVQDQGLFSVVHSRRSGPTDIEQGHPPRSQSVHLLSLEGLVDVDDGETVFVPGEGDLVAFVSLYRWSYLCQPPLSVNFIDAMRAVGIQVKVSLSPPRQQENQKPDVDEIDEVGLVQTSGGGYVTQDGTYSVLLDAPENSYLRCSRGVVDKLTKNGPPVDAGQQKLRNAMAERLRNGYTMVRSLVASGEETVGLFRGALLPALPNDAKNSWPFQSNNGQDFQIMDPVLRLMDLSYASAWELGRTMATSDIQFVSALMRVRTKAYQERLLKLNLVAANTDINLTTKGAFLTRLPASLENLRGITSVESVGSVGLKLRWDRSGREMNTGWDSGVGEVSLMDHFKVEGSARGLDDVPIQDLLPPTSDDWKTIHDWVLDRMYLEGIPTHYLIPDPNYLPVESIRFFHIDKNWMDCLIDGALSCANHTALNEEDTIRDAIKRQFNVYLGTKIKGVENTPQVPVFGLLLRSAVVSVFKDLIVEADLTPEPTLGESSILLQKRLSPDILLVLFDRRPEGIKRIKFSQPPNQQRFSVADELNNSKATFLFRKLDYPSSPSSGGSKPIAPADFLSQFEDPVFVEPGKQDSKLYDFDSRCVDFRRMRTLFFNSPNEVGERKQFYEYYGPNSGRTKRLTSAFVGLELNDTAKYIEIMTPWDGSPPPGTRPPYQIRVRSESSNLPKARGKLRSVLFPDNTSSPSSSSPADLKALAMTAPAMAKPAKPKLLMTPHSAPLASTPAQPGMLPPPTHMGSKVPVTANPPPKHHGRRAMLKTVLENKTANIPLVHFRTSSPSRSVGGQLLHISSRPPPPRLTNPAFTVVAFHREFRRPLRTNAGQGVPPSWISTKVDFAADLIFALRPQKPGSAREQALWETVHLAEVRILLPLGPSKERKGDEVDNRVRMCPGWAPKGRGGYRVRMLSNQRWVGTLESVDGGKYLGIRLIPRSLRKTERLTLTEELSFGLSGIETGWSSGREGFEGGANLQCFAELREFYALPNDPTNRAGGTPMYFPANRKFDDWDELLEREKQELRALGHI